MESETTGRPLRIAVVAGEASGDLLGAGLIRALRERFPGAEFEGVPGPQMAAEGCRELAPLERLSVMGFVEVLGRLPELLALRRRLRDHFLAEPPDLFIGIDAPDFNLGLERALKRAGIPAVHYVSPSVWAWRRSRLKRIARSTDLVLTLFPFEAEFYRAHDVAVRFVGHPLADLVPERVDRPTLRRALDLPEEGEIVALLPGSRRSELKHLTEPFLAAVRWLRERRPHLHFVAPMANESTEADFRAALAAVEARHGPLPVTVVSGAAREAMGAADAVLVASGTATLEALLLRRPMVVAYRMAPLTYRIARWRLKVPYYSLPNNLAGRAVVEEITQDEVTGERLGAALLALLEHPERAAALTETFAAIHAQLRRDASHAAAAAIGDYLSKRPHHAAEHA